MSIKQIKMYMQNGEYADDYEWSATSGDDPKKKKLDRKLLSRREGYEVADLIEDILNALHWNVSAENVATLEDDIHKEYDEVESRDELYGYIVAFHVNN